MTKQELLDKYNDAITGLFKDNNNEEITPQRLRDFVQDVADQAYLSATEVLAGIILIADSSEALAGIIDTKAMTPAKVAAYVAQEISNLVDSSPETLDTLNEIAEALNNDPNFYTTITDLINNKQDIESAASSGTSIAFDKKRIYGTLSAPESGNITFDATGAKRGVVQTVIHQAGTAPTFGAEFEILNDTAYVEDEVNYIYMHLVATTALDGFNIINVLITQRPVVVPTEFSLTVAQSINAVDTNIRGIGVDITNDRLYIVYGPSDVPSDNFEERQLSDITNLISQSTVSDASLLGGGQPYNHNKKAIVKDGYLYGYNSSTTKFWKIETSTGTVTATAGTDGVANNTGLFVKEGVIYAYGYEDVMSQATMFYAPLNETTLELGTKTYIYDVDDTLGLPMILSMVGEKFMHDDQSPHSQFSNNNLIKSDWPDGSNDSSQAFHYAPFFWDISKNYYLCLFYDTVELLVKMKQFSDDALIFEIDDTITNTEYIKAYLIDIISSTQYISCSEYSSPLTIDKITVDLTF